MNNNFESWSCDIKKTYKRNVGDRVIAFKGKYILVYIKMLSSPIEFIPVIDVQYQHNAIM